MSFPFCCMIFILEYFTPVLPPPPSLQCERRRRRLRIGILPFSRDSFCVCKKNRALAVRCDRDTREKKRKEASAAQNLFPTWIPQPLTPASPPKKISPPSFSQETPFRNTHLRREKKIRPLLSSSIPLPEWEKKYLSLKRATGYPCLSEREHWRNNCPGKKYEIFTAWFGNRRRRRRGKFQCCCYF